MNSSINIKEIGFELENFLAKTTSGPNGFAGECYRTLKEEIIPILRKLPENRTVHSEFITLRPKPDKHITGTESYSTVSLIKIDANFLNRMLSN